MADTSCHNYGGIHVLVIRGHSIDSHLMNWDGAYVKKGIHWMSLEWVRSFGFFMDMEIHRYIATLLPSPHLLADIPGIGAIS